MKFGLGTTPEKNGIPHIERIAPAAAIPGGEIAIYGSGFTSRHGGRPLVRFGEAEAALSLASSNRLIARVPENANGTTVQIVSAERESQPFPVALGFQIADNLHPVSSPAVDSQGNIYVTFSGPRGQRVPVSLFKISSSYAVKPFVTSLINPTGLALNSGGDLFVSCRHDGTIYRISPDGRSEQWIEGMGIATGLAFDSKGNLFVGDRSGTIFKITSRSTQAANSTSAGPPPPVTTASIASPKMAKSTSSIAASAARRASLSIRTKTYTSSPPSADAAASFASLLKVTPSTSSAAQHSWASPSCQAAAESSPQTAPSSPSIGTSAACLFTVDPRYTNRVPPPPLQGELQYSP